MTPDLPLPARNFAATHRILLIVFAASVLVPFMCLCGYGYFDFQRRVADANDVIDRLARVGVEQAVKVMDLNEAIGTRIIDLLGNGDDRAIRARERTLHDAMTEIGGGYPQVAAISVLGVDGDLLASSRFYPAPNESIKQREDFREIRARRPKPNFSLPMLGRLTGLVIFDTGMGRSAPNGAFLGAVMIALRQDYFRSFYADLVSNNDALLIGLYRDDGGLLARYPEVRPGTNPAPNTAFVAALASGQQAGHLRMRSTIDGVERYLSYRRVGDYPLYVSVGYAHAAIFAQWWPHLMIVASLTALPCVAVWLLIAFSLRRLREEQRAWERWQSEVGLRLSAEAASRHLQRMGALGNLVANVAHDFNNLLMVVDANMSLVRHKGFRNAEPEVLAVERAAANAETVARRLLSVARKQPLKPAPLDLATWLLAASGLLHTSVGHSIEMRVDVPADIWPVFTDPTELELALINIAVNARDVLQPGGRFSIVCENVRLDAADGHLAAGEYVRISLTDSGEGMSEEVRLRVFEPLFTTKVVGSGTGLGLTQVLAACEQAGGTARIESAPGAGTTVRLYLARYVGPDKAVPPVEPDRCASDAPATSCSVLVAEDNAEVAAAVTAVLDMFGCRVQTVASGDEAWQTLQAGATFDLVLSDIQMPGRLNGIDLAERVRATYPLQKIALMTGYADELGRAKHLHVPVLPKPFDIDELRALIPEAA
ncbi:hybrid sensor histidine kinase/response regulator [Pararobbsia silviterrae]|nr:hybrid sensor histidine kinase/response regulator [Pararobbsia silviterrae]